MQVEETRSPLRRLSWLLAASISAGVLAATPGGSAVITVDLGCSLGDAIRAANSDTAVAECTAGSGPDEIHLTGDVTLDEIDNETRGANALPVVTTEITLVGNGFTIARAEDAPQMRLFYVEPQAVLSVYSTKIAGSDLDGTSDFSGAAILYLGKLALVNSTITNNRSLWNGSAIGTFEGVYDDTRSLALINSRITGNLEARSAVYVAGDTLVRDTTIADNDGTGLRDEHGSSGTRGLDIQHSTISGNTGRGLQAEGSDTRLTNSTISGNNFSDGYTGGGLDGFAFGQSSIDFVVRQSTLAYNFESQIYAGPLNCRLVLDANAITGDPTVSSCINNCSDANQGGNATTDDTCGASTLLTGLDPVLRDNGGPTLTHALLPGSAAIDAAGDCRVGVDQRGLPRDPDACDSGAFELVTDPILLSAAGNCPGTISGTVTEATPDGALMLISGESYGANEVPADGCASVRVGVEPPTFRQDLTANADGEAGFVFEAMRSQCDDLLQVIDLTTCRASVAATVGEPPE